MSSSSGCDGYDDSRQASDKCGSAVSNDCKRVLAYAAEEAGHIVAKWEAVSLHNLRDLRSKVGEDRSDDLCFGGCQRQARSSLSDDAVAEGLDHVGHDEYDLVEVAVFFKFP